MGQVGFAVGTGRCGTKFLAEVFARDPAIASHHERHPFGDTFDRYCRWYGLDVDDAGFVAAKRRGIAADLAAHSFSFEASAFLSLSLDTLVKALGAKVVLMVRRPEKVVASYLRKGWYENDAIVGDPGKLPSVQDVAQPHHFLGRTMPRGQEFARWSELTRVGKIAWYWSCLNASLLAQAEALPAGATRLQRLEDLNYAAFDELRAFLGAPRNLSEAEFAGVRRKRPNASYGMRTVHDWDERERSEFENETRDVAERLGYVWSTEKLASAPAPVVMPSFSQRVAAQARMLARVARGAGPKRPSVSG